MKDDEKLLEIIEISKAEADSQIKENQLNTNTKINQSSQGL